MDILKKTITKYRWALLVAAVGVLLMLLPTSSEAEPQESEIIQEETVSLAQELEEILSRIDGVGQVKVLLSIAEGERTIYQYDEGTGLDTVIITDENRAQTPVVQQVLPPVYQGAVIVCQGAGSASVKLMVVEAVAAVTGLRSDQISVLKMK